MFDYSNVTESSLANSSLYGVFIGMFILSSIIGLIVCISYWKLFKKAGKPGWAILVPIYNIIVLLEIAELPMVYFLLLFIPFANIYVYFKTNICIAKRFGKSTGFGIGMSLLSIIFIPLLAFSDDEINNNSSETNNENSVFPPIGVEKTTGEVSDASIGQNNIDNIAVSPISIESNNVQNVEVEAPAEPVNNEVPVESVVNEVAAEPVNNEVPTEPAVNEAAAEPVNNDAPVEPVVNEVAVEPVNNEVPTEPVVNEAAAEPVNNEVPVESVVNEVAVEPVSNDVPVEPVVNEAPAEPVNNEVPVEPVVNEVPVEPVVNEVPVEPVVNEVQSGVEEVNAFNATPDIVDNTGNTENTVSDDKKICKNCGNEMPNIVSICPNCGTENE